jgi:hypothetical protein
MIGYHESDNGVLVPNPPLECYVDDGEQKGYAAFTPTGWLLILAGIAGVVGAWFIG